MVAPQQAPLPLSTQWMEPQRSNHHAPSSIPDGPSLAFPLFTVVILMIRGVRASILWGILFVTFISWIPNCGNKATYFGECNSIPGGEARYQYFLKGGQAPSVTMTGGKQNFPGLSKQDTWVALITFLYLDFMDATSVMVSGGQKRRTPVCEE